MRIHCLSYAICADIILRELSKLSRETQHLSHENWEIKESLLRIRRASDLTLEGMKAAIDEILAKVCSSVDFCALQTK